MAEQYYGFIDQQVGRLLRHVDDEMLVVIVSDHGSMPMQGCFCINQWLIERGYLTLRQMPNRVPLSKSRTSIGHARRCGAREATTRGYFFNLAGREATGIVSPEGLPALKSRLTADLNGIPGPGRKAPRGPSARPPRDLRYRARRPARPDGLLR